MIPGWVEWNCGDEVRLDISVYCRAEMEVLTYSWKTSTVSAGSENTSHLAVRVFIAIALHIARGQKDGPLSLGLVQDQAHGKLPVM